jgi:hypothetical protein
MLMQGFKENILQILASNISVRCTFLSICDWYCHKDCGALHLKQKPQSGEKLVE